MADTLYQSADYAAASGRLENLLRIWDVEDPAPIADNGVFPLCHSIPKFCSANSITR